MPVTLNSEFFACENPNQHTKHIIIMHGLFGSTRNWTTVAGLLQKKHNVHALDARNHGDSEHSDSHTLEDMIEDAVHWYQNQSDVRSEKPVWLGHSMGGLSAMGVALKNPDLAGSIVIADIAPKDYEPHHGPEFDALKVSLEGAESRREIDKRMAAIHQNPFVRRFLQMNLERLEDGSYRWKLNIPALEHAAYLETTELFGQFEPYNGPALFLRGMKSDYINETDYETINGLFPKAQIRELDADHWMHYTAQDEFMSALNSFLESF